MSVARCLPRPLLRALGVMLASAALAACRPQGPDADAVHAAALPPAVAASACRTASLSFDPEQTQRHWRELFESEEFRTLDAAIAEFREESRRTYCSDRPFEVVFRTLGDAAPDRSSHYAQWIRQHPDSAPALAARAYHHLGRALLVRGGRRASATAEDRLTRLDGHLELAVADARAARQIDAGFTPAAVVLLQAAQQRGAVERALAEYPTYLAAAPDSYVLPEHLLRMLAPKWGGSAAALDAALAAALQAADANPDLRLLPSQAACIKADDALFRGDVQGAISTMLPLLRASAGEVAPLCRLYLARALERQDRRRESIELRLVYQAQQGPSALAEELVTALLGADRHSEADDRLQRALAIDQGSPQLHCQRAAILAQRGDRAGAAASVQAGFAILADHPYCVRLATALALDGGRPTDRALARLRARAEDNVGRHGVQYLEAAALHNEARFDEALPLAREAVAKAPRGFEERLLLARIHEHRREWAAALEQVNEAIQLDSARSEAWFLRGRLRVFGLQQFDQGLSDLREARGRGETHPELWYAIASAQYRKRDCEFLPNLRRYLEACEGAQCVAVNLANARKHTGDSGWRKLCPDA